MLNILVCVKQIPDVDLVKMDPETGNLIRTGVPTLTNPLDLNALEAAVQVKERYGGEITLITMGPPMAEETLRECLAVGGDDAILITGRPFGGADTLSTSYSIVMAADMKGKFDLIFCGKETMDGATGQMASQLAERFDASQISCCFTVDEIADGKVRATRTLETGKEVVEATMPCLITVEKDNFYGRLPNLKAYLDSKTAPITTYTENDIDGLDLRLIGVPGSGTIVPKIYPPELPEPGQIIRTGSPKTDVSRLLELLAEKGSI
ncbi:MAG: electron transfer flavoprotein subunit beta/FixA family protein [Clostridia bacterium]|jgi:electron transfer flavoprotein beta subunit|nr:electron transfer flavoprotein subunit beta/FixA family protein [Clostridia bacterium]